GPVEPLYISPARRSDEHEREVRMGGSEPFERGHQRGQVFAGFDRADRERERWFDTCTADGRVKVRVGARCWWVEPVWDHAYASRIEAFAYELAAREGGWDDDHVGVASRELQTAFVEAPAARRARFREPQERDVVRGDDEGAATARWHRETWRVHDVTSDAYRRRAQAVPTLVAQGTAWPPDIDPPDVLAQVRRRAAGSESYDVDTGRL
ncbi:MAG: hypothetical protein JWL83_3154, partial [Actinomycetia bacterium]|nr:hypothetical protein [Actinomycetes bacterium]